jgi:hypothetical protein
METGEIKKRYEWIASSRVGKVETYLAEDETTVYFESGRIVPKELLDVQLRQIEEEVYQVKEKQQQIQSPPPVPTYQDIPPNLGLEVPGLNPVPTPVVEEQNPIRIILNKQKKKETLTILVDIEIDVPTKKVLELLDVMFDRDEVIDEIIKSSIEKVKTDALQQRVTDSIKEKILSLFEGENDEKDDLKNEMPSS